MKDATHILSRSSESLKSEAVKIASEINELEKQLFEKEVSLEKLFKSINDLEQAILKLEKPDVGNENSVPTPTSKSKKAKR